MRKVLGILWIPIYLLMYGVCFIVFIITSTFTQFLGSTRSQSIGKFILTSPEKLTFKVFNV